MQLNVILNHDVFINFRIFMKWTESEKLSIMLLVRPFDCFFHYKLKWAEYTPGTRCWSNMINLNLLYPTPIVQNYIYYFLGIGRNILVKNHIRYKTTLILGDVWYSIVS